MRALVTGAGGFIGTALCRRLLERGDVVRGTFRTRSAISGVEPVHVPELASADWARLVAGVDVVYHLAARVHVMNDDPVRAEADCKATNVDATAALARAAVEARVGHLVFLSSVKAAAEASFASPLREQDEPRPEDAYGRSKLEAERALEAARRESGMRITTLRPPLVYGPGVGANFLRLLKSVDRGIPLPLGGIDNRRSVIFSGNLVDAMVASVQRGEASSRTFYVADAESLSTRELVVAIAHALGRPPRLLPVPRWLLRGAGLVTRRSDAVQRVTASLEVDTTAIRTVLGWLPPFPTAAGLESTVQWFRGRR